MARATRKHVTSPIEPPSDAGFERPDGHMLHTHEVAGSLAPMNEKASRGPDPGPPVGRGGAPGNTLCLDQLARSDVLHIEC
jgi:hypothetical protein